MWKNPRPIYPNELYHHGIKGQSWGVKNGPPYPLDKAVSRAIKKETRAVNKETKRSDKEFERASYWNNLYSQKFESAMKKSISAYNKYKSNPTTANHKAFIKSHAKAEDIKRRLELWEKHADKLNDKNVERANTIQKQYGDAVKRPTYDYHDKLLLMPNNSVHMVQSKWAASQKRINDYRNNPFGIVGDLTMLGKDIRYRNSVEKSKEFDPKYIRTILKNRDPSIIPKEYRKYLSNNTARHNGK
jgi:hypothetical protein